MELERGSLVPQYLGPAKVRELEVMARNKAVGLIVQFAGVTTCEVVNAVAGPLRMSLFAEPVGLPFEQFRQQPATSVCRCSAFRI